MEIYISCSIVFCLFSNTWFTELFWGCKNVQSPSMPLAYQKTVVHCGILCNSISNALDLTQSGNKPLTPFLDIETVHIVGNSSSRDTRTCWSDKVNIIPADTLVTHVTRASAAMVLSIKFPAQVGSVACVASQVGSVACVASQVGSVACVASQVGSVACVASQVGSVACVASQVGSVACVASQVGSVACVAWCH